jgi:hypothetical protein
LIAEWRINGKGLPAIAAPSTNGAIAINALILRYMDFAGTYYVKHGQDQDLADVAAENHALR